MSFLIVFTEYCIACLTGLALVLQLSSATNIIDGGLKLNSSEKSPTFVKIDNFAENGTIYQRTKKSCNETQTCKHGGSCLKHACVCLPGTSGELCEIIDDCVKGTLCHLNRETTCEYSVEKQRAYCECHVMEWRFDDASKTCQDCLCTPWGHQDLTSFSNCEFQQGQQICSCTEGFSYNPSRQVCEICDCGENSTWCAFDRDGKQMCGCEKGFVSSGYRCNKCNCMSHGTCKGYSFDCICDEGYVQKRDVCVACSCGKHGECIFDNENNQTGCKCEPGYAVKAGKCEFCECGENSTCSFQGDQKVCECAAGFEGVNGFCADVNECEKHNPCKKSTRCYNNIGSYACICDIGYKRNRLSGECEDINECEIPTSCSDPNSECVNTDGSYYCVCSSGYAARGGIYSNTFCEKSQTAVLTTFYLSVFACTLILGFGVIWHQFHLYRKRTNNGTIHLEQ